MSDDFSKKSNEELFRIAGLDAPRATNDDFSKKSDEELFELAGIKPHKNPQESGFARSVGRGLRHTSAAINSVFDIPRGLVDTASTLIRNKPFFDPKNKTYAQEAVEKIDIDTKGKLKPRNKNEEAWDKYAPAVLPALVTRNPKAIIGAMTATKAADLIHDAETDPDSMFHGLSPREKLAIISLAGGTGFEGVRRGIKSLAKKADKGNLSSIAQLNEDLVAAGHKPIQAGMSDYFPSDKFTLSGGAAHGKIKAKHDRLSGIIRGEEDAAHLPSFFDERGLRPGAPVYVKAPIVEFSKKKISPKKKADVEVVSEKTPDPVPVTPKSRPEMTQAELRAELQAQLKEFEAPGYGGASSEAMSQYQRAEQAPLIQSLKKLREEPVAEMTAAVQAPQEVLAPQYQIVKSEKGTKWVVDKSTPDIALTDVSDALTNPKGHKVIKEFSHSLPDAASRNDAGRALIQSLSPDGNWIEIAQKYNQLPGRTKVELANMLYPSERAPFKGAMHYAGRTLSKLEKEAGKQKITAQPFGAADVTNAIISHGATIPVKLLARHGVPMVKKGLSRLAHTKWAENLIRNNG